jgi:hypothetical protein
MSAALARTFAVMDVAAVNKPSAYQQNTDGKAAVRPLRRRRVALSVMSPLARPLALFPFFRP